MFAPSRLAYSFRPESGLAAVIGAASVALMFAATPFLIPAVADRYEVSAGVAGMISTTQVGAFALMTFVLPRVVAPSATVLSRSVLILATANTASALPDLFPVLLALRFVGGAAAGAITWVAWAHAMRGDRGLGRIAAAAPVAALIGTPLLALVAESGDQSVYLVLAAATIPIALIPMEVSGSDAIRSAVSRSRSNRVLLVALFLLTLTGASLFVYEAVAATEALGMSSTAASLGFSLNAGGGLLGARLASRHVRPGWWLASIGPAAVLTVVGGNALWFYAGMTWWGFAFWMGVPGVLQMLAARSLEPGERAGDAQGMMAVGRASGPLVGGVFVDSGSFTGLAAAAGIGVVVSGALVVGVAEGRDRLPVSDPRVG